MNLPTWLTESVDGDWIINGDSAYPELVTLLSEKRKEVPASSNEAWAVALRDWDGETLDQYFIEVLYQMVKLEVRRCLLLNGESAWPNRMIIKADKKLWALKNFPEGRGAEAATKGKEAREIYRFIFGFVPN